MYIILVTPKTYSSVKMQPTLERYSPVWYEATQPTLIVVLLKQFLQLKLPFLAVQTTDTRAMSAGRPGWQWRCHQACAHDEVCNSLLIEARFPKLIYSRIGSKYPVPIPYVLPCILEIYLS